MAGNGLNGRRPGRRGSIENGLSAGRRTVLNGGTMSLSRRGLFSAFLKPLQGRSKGGPDGKAGGVSPLVPTDQVAVIQGRHCLAYQQEYCSVCYERCPVPGAIDFNEGMPRIVLETCTGCAVCRDVCPAPENAILLTPRRAGFGA